MLTTCNPFRPIYKHKPQPTFSVRMLTDKLEMFQRYNVTLVLDDLSEDVEIAWATISDTIRRVAKDIIGYRRSHWKPWLSHEAMDTIDAKA